jgi:hypothetical protein
MDVNMYGNSMKPKLTQKQNTQRHATMQFNRNRNRSRKITTANPIHQPASAP